MSAVLLGTFMAKLVSIGGVLAFIGGYLRGIRPALFLGGIGAAIEWFLHASMYQPSARALLGFLVVPVAMVVAGALGWGGAWAVEQGKQKDG